MKTYIGTSIDVYKCGEWQINAGTFVREEEDGIVYESNSVDLDGCYWCYKLPKDRVRFTNQAVSAAQTTIA